MDVQEKFKPIVMLREGNETFLTRMWKHLTNRRVFKLLTALCNGPKRTTSTSGGLELLQMVSELDTDVPAKTLGLKRRGGL